MARKLTGNSQIDYQNGFLDGKNKGYNLGYKEGGEQAIIYARHFAVLPIYNIVQKYIKSEKKQLEMVKEYALEQNRIYGEEFWGDNDKVLLAMHGVKRIYKEVGLTDGGFEIDVEEEN